MEECVSQEQNSAHLSDGSGRARYKKGRSEGYRSDPSGNQLRTKKIKKVHERSRKRIVSSSSDEEVGDERKTKRTGVRRLKHRSDRSGGLKRKNQCEANKNDVGLLSNGTPWSEKPSTSSEILHDTESVSIQEEEGMALFLLDMYIDQRGF